MAMNNPSQEKMHYDSLISLFKYVIGATTLLAGVVVFMIGSSLTEIKKTISDDVKESAKKLESVKSDADKTVADTKANAKEVLQYTRDLTTIQINLLKEEAKNLALSSARNKVEEAFKNNNVQTLIDVTARKEINDKLKEVVKEETDKTREVFSYQIQLTIAFDQIGKRNRESLNYMDSLSNDAENEVIRKFSKELLIQKGKDYDQELNLHRFPKDGSQPILSRYRQIMTKRLFLSEDATDNEIIKSIIARIKTDTDVRMIAHLYEHLRMLSNIDFMRMLNERI